MKNVVKVLLIVLAVGTLCGCSSGQSDNMTNSAVVDPASVGK